MIKDLIHIGGVVAELGVFEGEFSKTIYDIVKPSRMYLVDSWEGKITSGDVDGNNVRTVTSDDALNKVVSTFSGMCNILVAREFTDSFLAGVQNDTFDLVYIDADHSYEGVKKDLRNAWPKIQPGGWLMGHDYEINHDKCQHYYNFGVKRAVDEFIDECGLIIKALAKDGCVSFAIQKPHDYPLTKATPDNMVGNIVVFSLSDRTDIHQRTWPRLYEYCKKQGYSFVKSEQTLDETRHQSWSKIRMAQMIMTKFPEASMYVWIDDDVFITDTDKRLEDILQGFIDNPNAVIAVQQDYYDQLFNLGVMAIKNIGLANQLLDEIWKSCAEDIKWGVFWEQTATTRLWKKNLSLRKNLHILQPRSIQSFYRPTDIDKYKWQEGDFAAHVLGTSNNHQRLSRLDELLGRFGHTA